MHSYQVRYNKLLQLALASLPLAKSHACKALLAKEALHRLLSLWDWQFKYKSLRTLTTQAASRSRERSKNCTYESDGREFLVKGFYKIVTQTRVSALPFAFDRVNPWSSFEGMWSVS